MCYDVLHDLPSQAEELEGEGDGEAWASVTLPFWMQRQRERESESTSFTLYFPSAILCTGLQVLDAEEASAPEELSAQVIAHSKS